MWLFRILLSGLPLMPWISAASLQPQIPSVQSFHRNESEPAFILSSATRILVDEAYASYSDFRLHGGPTLLDFAQTLWSDLVQVTSFTLTPVQVAFLDKELGHFDDHRSAVVLTLNSSSSHTLYSGVPTSEAYDFVISNSSYMISGSGSTGAWWGTRTLLQQLILSEQVNGTYRIPAGKGSDGPGWEIRGFMLDAGRHWYTTEFLAEICTYASFFKINEFHIHASDNTWMPEILYGADWRSLYSGFRFEPPRDSLVAGLVPHRNESWNYTAFSYLQSHCARHGITIVPEIDTPAHALIISQWHPMLMQDGKPDILNLSYPETIPTIKSIWSQFLPWFSSGEVSIGADEYSPSLADEYVAFVNEMSSYVGDVSGKRIRVWNANEASKISSISTNVTIQHWDSSASIPVDLLDSGYRIINSENYFLYLEGKVPAEGGFPQSLNLSLLFSGATPGGGGWAPNIFSAEDTGNNTSYNNAGLRGAIFALWNDWGPNATTPLETYYQLSQSLAVFAEKTWAGSGIRDSELTMDQFQAAYPLLNARAPGQNLNRAVKGKKASDINVFAFEDLPSLPFHTGVESVGPPYTLSFRVQPDAADVSTDNTMDAALFEGTDSLLYASSLTFASNGEYYPLPTTCQLRPGVWTNVTIQATRDYTFATVVQEGGKAETCRYQTTLNIWGEYLMQANMSFAAPSATIGSNAFRGNIANVILRIGSD